MKTVEDGWTWTEATFANWRTAADRRLKEIYSITLEDTGVDDEFLQTHWKDKEPPFEFVLWYGNKYDLDPITIWPPYQIRSGLLRH
jgi:hypothetical protein